MRSRLLAVTFFAVVALAGRAGACPPPDFWPPAGTLLPPGSVIQISGAFFGMICCPRMSATQPALVGDNGHRVPLAVLVDGDEHYVLAPAGRLLQGTKYRLHYRRPGGPPSVAIPVYWVGTEDIMRPAPAFTPPLALSLGTQILLFQLLPFAFGFMTVSLFLKLRRRAR